MADMELIIKIPDHLYKLLKDFPSDSNESTIENVLTKAVEHGTPLPKGHWINAEQKVTAQLYDDQYEIFKEKEMTIAEYLDAYTNEGCPMSIIEADKEQTE